MVNIPNETSLSKTNFSFASGLQSKISSWLRMGACDCFPHSVLGPHLFWTCMCTPCIYCYSMWFHLCISPVVSVRHRFLGVIDLMYRGVASTWFHVWTWANISVHIYLEVRDQHQLSFSNTSSFLRQGLSLNMNPVICIDWLVCKVQESICLHIPSPGMTDASTLLTEPSPQLLKILLLNSSFNSLANLIAWILLLWICELLRNYGAFLFHRSCGSKLQFVYLLELIFYWFHGNILMDSLLFVMESPVLTQEIESQHQYQKIIKQNTNFQVVKKLGW